MGEIVQLGEADWADGVALARAVGWRDAVEDWQGLATVGTVLGLRDGGALVATGALCDLGSRLTVAKMLVHPSRQRQGLGQRLLREVLARAGTRPVALVATPAGRSLYARHGFQTVEHLRVHHGRSHAAAPSAAADLTDADFESACALDEAVTACQRRPLLQRQWRAAERRVGIRRAGTLVALGLRLPQSEGFIVGPIHAPDDAHAVEVLRALLPGDGRQGRVDLVASNEALRRCAVALGLTQEAPRDEMTLGGAALPGLRSQRVAPLALAYG